jgi:hypothetical protein
MQNNSVAIGEICPLLPLTMNVAGKAVSVQASARKSFPGRVKVQYL